MFICSVVDIIEHKTLKQRLVHNIVSSNKGIPALILRLLPSSYANSDMKTFIYY